MYQAWLRRSLLVLAATAAVFGGNPAIAQSFDPNIVSRVDSFIPPAPQTVLPSKTTKVPVKKTKQVTVTVEEKKNLTIEEREAKARAIGIVVPLGLRSTTARRAYLNMRGVPSQIVTHVRKQKSRTVTTIVEKREPRKTVVRGSASGGYNYASNANQTNIDIIADSIDSQNANLLVLVPAGREEDTVSFLLGSTDTRYANLNSSSFDALNGSITYTRLLGRRQTAEGLNTGGTATTDILTVGLDGTSVYESGFGAEEIAIAVLEAEELQEGVDPAIAQPGLDMIKVPRELEEFPRAQLVVEGGRIRDITDPRLRPFRFGKDVASRHASRAGGWAQEADQHPDRRRLPRAVRPQEAEKLPGPHLQIELLHGRQGPVALGQEAGGQHRPQSTGVGFLNPAWAASPAQFSSNSDLARGPTGFSA